MAAQRSRGWCFTINNYTDEHIKTVRELDAEYIVFGREIAPTTGTPHLQCFAYFKSQRTFQSMKKTLPEGAHIEKANGTPEHNREYCMKEHNAEEIGTCPMQGKRTDCATIKKMVKEGATIREIAEVATSYQTIKFAQTLLSIAPNATLRTNIHVRWYWGATATGKTRAAFEEATAISEPWISSRNLRWWDGYTGQKCVIIDDMRGDFCTFHEMLRILDIYPLRLEIKGGSVAAAYTNVWITSAYPPDKIWQSIEDKEQLLRRIHEIKEFRGHGDAPAE